MKNGGAEGGAGGGAGEELTGELTGELGVKQSFMKKLVRSWLK